MDSFCSNDLCILHGLVVPDDQTEADIAYPDGSTGEMHRVLFRDATRSWWYCEACANAVNLVLKGERVTRPTRGITTGGILLDRG